MSLQPKRDIATRFSKRVDAERYRDRFRTGWRHRGQVREELALESALSGVSGPIGTIIDIGSGPGRFVPILRAHSARLIQVDYSVHMLNVSREDHPPVGSDHCIRADARHLPLADQCADLVFCHRLLNHISDAESRRCVLGELRRISARYVLISCLMAPALVRAVRRSIAFLRGRSSIRSAIDNAVLLNEAIAAGLVLDARIPIRRVIAPCEFQIFSRS